MRQEKNIWNRDKLTSLEYAYVLPFDIMNKYLEGDLDEESRLQVEAYISAHPEEQDTLEGIKLMKEDEIDDSCSEFDQLKQLKINEFLEKVKIAGISNQHTYSEEVPIAQNIYEQNIGKNFNKDHRAFISNFNRQLLRRRSLQAAYSFICETIKTVLNCRSASIFLYAESGNLERKYISGFYKGLEPEIESFRNGQGFVGKAVGTRELYGETIVCNDTPKIREEENDLVLKGYVTNFENALYAQHGIQETIENLIVTPLNAFRRSSGVIRVVNKLAPDSQTLDSNGFTEEDVIKLQIIAESSATAISYLKLEKRENVLNNIPNLLYEFGPKRVFDKIANSLINDSTLYGACIIRLVDLNNRNLEVRGSTIKNLEADIEKMKLETGINGNAFYADTYIKIKNLKEDAQAFLEKEWAKQQGLVSMICFPLKSSDKNITYGTLCVYTKFKFKFGKDDINYLESFANQVARIIQLIQEENEQRFLKELSESLIKESDIEDLMKKTAKALPQITGFDKCYFLGREGNELHVLPRRSGHSPIFSLNSEIGQKILSNPDDVFEFPEVRNALELKGIYAQVKNLRSLVIIPISSSEKELYGILVLVCKKSKDITSKPERSDKAIKNLIAKLDLNLLHTIENLFSNAIEKMKEREAKEKYQKEFIEQGQLLKILIDKVPDLIYVKDKEHKFILVNEAQAKILNLSSPDDAEGKSDLNFFDIQAATRYHQSEDELFEGNKECIHVDERVFDKKNQRNLIFSTTKVKYYNRAGEVKGLVGIGRDITDLKLNEIQQENMITELKRANQEAEKAVEVIKSQYAEFKHTVGKLSKKLISELDPNSKGHLYARIIAADYFVERELFAKYLSNQSLKSGKWERASIKSVFDGGFDDIIKHTPKAFGVNSSVIINIDNCENKNYRFDKKQIQDILISLVMNVIKHKISGSCPTIYIESIGEYLSVKNDFQKIPKNIDKLKKEVSSSIYQNQGSTLFTIDKYFKENYDNDIDIDYRDEQFIIGLPFRTNN